MEAHLRLAAAGYPVLSFGTGTQVRLPGPRLELPNIYNFNTTSYDAIYNDLNSKDPRLYKNNGLLNMLDRNRDVKWGPERWQDWQPGLPRMIPRGVQMESHGAAASYPTEPPSPMNSTGDAAADAQARLTRPDRGSKGVEGGWVDIVITCEERCWDSVIEDLQNRANAGSGNRPVHVINVDIKDNHEEALIAGRAILNLANQLNAVAKQEREKTPGIQGFGQAARAAFDERVPEVLAQWGEQYPNLPALWTVAWI
jgi:RNA polymerase II subunit A C-terminal domain phosphatase SSU72